MCQIENGHNLLDQHGGICQIKAHTMVIHLPKYHIITLKDIALVGYKAWGERTDKYENPYMLPLFQDQRYETIQQKSNF